MKMNTYDKSIPKAKVVQNKMPSAVTGETKYDGLAAGFQKQQAAFEAQEGKAIQAGMNKIGNTITQIAGEELKDNAIQTGKENAQLDFAEIQKLKKTRDEAVQGMYHIEDKESTEFALLKDQTFKIDTRMKQLLEKGSRFNVSERVRSDELNEIYVSQVSLDSKATINTLANTFRNNPENFEKEANKLLAQADAVPQQFRETIKAKITTDIANNKSRITENVKKKHLETLGATRNQSLTVLTNEVTQLARDGKATVGTIDEINSIMMKQLNDEIITPDQYNKTMNYINKNVVKQKVMGRADSISESTLTDTQKVKALLKNASEFNDASQPLINQDEKSIIYNDLVRRAGLYETKVKTQIASQNKIDAKKLGKIVARAKSGGSLGKTDIAEAKSIALKLGRTDELNGALVILDNVNRFQASTPGSQKNYLTMYAQAIEVADANGQSTMEMRAVYDILEKQGLKNAEDIKNDPIGYTMENPQKFGGTSYQPKSLDQANQLIETDEKGNVSYAKYSSAVADELSSRFDNKDNFLQHVGNFAVLSPTEVSNLNRKYTEMSVADKGLFLKSLNGAIGASQSNEVFSQMWADKPDSSSIAGMFYNKGSKGATVADDILLGQSLRLQGEVKLDATQKTELKDTIYAKMAASTYLIDPKHLNMYSQAISDHYLGNNIQANTLDTGSIQDSFEEITNGVIEYNDKPLLAPERGKDDGDIKDWMKYMGSNNMALETQYGDTPPEGYSSWRSFKEDMSNVEGDVWGMGAFDVKTIGESKYVMMKDGGVVKHNGQPMVFDWFKENKLDDRGNKIPWYQGQE